MNNETRNKIKIQSKRNVELWIYSFADMYMILSVFFIALAVIYAAKVKKDSELSGYASAGRGPQSVISELELNFDNASISLTEEAITELQLFLPATKANKNSWIEVEGYSDSGGIKKGSPFTSNLDLSTRRAVAVSEWFIKNGVSPGNVRVYSYGNGRVWSKKEVGSNRRVVVKLAAKGVTHE